MSVSNPFLDFDILLSALRDNYIIKASEMIYEASSTPQADSDWYIKWKAETVMSMKNAFSKSKAYSMRQIEKYDRFLITNKQYFDINKYPPADDLRITDAPDYETAISRIRKPLANLSAVPLDKIEVGGRTSNNQWFMKMLISDYDGNGTGFLSFCENYFNGNDNKKTLESHDMVKFIPIMYKYCMDYNSLVNTLDSQLHAILTYINQDPISKQVNATDTAEKELELMAKQKQQQASKMASTNPQKNVIHASADYLAFRESFMILTEITNSASIPSKSQSKPMNNQSNTIMNQKQQSPSNNPNQLVNKQQQDKNTGTVVVHKANQKQIIMKKKQVACEIMKDYFHAKVDAASLIYRDFIVTLETAFHLIQEQIKKTKIHQQKEQKAIQNKRF